MLPQIERLGTLASSLRRNQEFWCRSPGSWTGTRTGEICGSVIAQEGVPSGPFFFFFFFFFSSWSPRAALTLFNVSSL